LDTTIDSVGRRDFDQILPGHGPIMSRGRMVNFRSYIDETNMRVEEGKKAGKTLAEVQKSITVESLKSKQYNGYSKYVADIRDSLFPHWGRVFIGPKEKFQDGVNGVTAYVYRHIDRV
jgi:hypothetical protein